ncbi:MAG TPA: acetyl-CoA carboxylase, carboxyltransferase subunit beta [Saprospiraceae bacterium]|nr:acetyl-CoA carboxylase carboxyltransferase subunit beta [Saprospiraceae bacterium]HRO09225.1 acetyl-CoA carboxylase, carboxyltransferase subunit beta [Saprospiraceae bacterium]HRP42587.1 acetyl-CoA carboxylase, carboxyltransferase subunit beta [Saprospiraceae bacterium]
MSWFKRLKEGIQTATKNKKETPDGLWHKCIRCSEMTTIKELREHLYICPKCDYHTRISSTDYFEILFDGKYTRLFDEIKSVDVLEFSDIKSYKSRLDDAYKKTKLNDSMSVATGKVNKLPLTVACMDFGFIGGSMGAVVGEKISRAIDYCIANRTPLMIISKSGGARMMESAYSLMQMAKSSAKLTLLAKEGLPYFSFMTDPTTGGVTASYAMLGDINFSEPEALIGFAGPRVIKETIKRDLPEGFQTAEYLLEHGFLDFIVHRKDLKCKISDLLGCFDTRKPDSELVTAS